jgi:hypothetical protein
MLNFKTGMGINRHVEATSMTAIHMHQRCSSPLMHFNFFPALYFLSFSNALHFLEMYLHLLLQIGLTPKFRAPVLKLGAFEPVCRANMISKPNSNLQRILNS